jgi:hypothetical protein
MAKTRDLAVATAQQEEQNDRSKERDRDRSDASEPAGEESEHKGDEPAFIVPRRQRP